MKKLILMMSVIFLINMESKAQQESQFIATTGLSTVKPVSFSMQTYGGPDKDYDFYMRRSKNYRAVGWSTLIGGVVISGIGLLVANSYSTSSTNSAGVLLLIGATSGIVSIPFMIMASANKRKAKLMISNQKTGFGVPLNVNKDITGFTIQIPIGK